MKDCIIDGKDRWSNFHDPGFEREGDGGVPRTEFDLHESPDAIGQLETLVDHVLAFKCTLGYSERLKQIRICIVQSINL